MDLAPTLAIPARGRATCEEEERLTFAGATGGCSMALDDGESQRLAAFETAIAGFSWSRDGTRLAVTHTTSSDDIVLLSNLGE